MSELARRLKATYDQAEKLAGLLASEEDLPCLDRKAGQNQSCLQRETERVRGKGGSDNDLKIANLCPNCAAYHHAGRAQYLLWTAYCLELKFGKKEDQP